MRRARIREGFISHASKDAIFVKKLVKVFRKNGIPYWFSPSHIPGAVEWHDEIGRALNRCDWFLIVLSPNAVKSDWVKRELTYVLRQHRYQGRIIPVYYRQCEHALLSWTLAGFQFVDFRKSFDSECERRLKTLGVRQKQRYVSAGRS